MPRGDKTILHVSLYSGGSITCEVTGHRKYGKGRGVLCVYEFREK